MSWAKYTGYHLAALQGLAPAAITTDGNGSALDRLHYDHMIAVLNIGAFASGTLDVSIQDSSTGSSGWADFTPNVIFANGDTTVTTAKFNQVTTTDANSVVKMDVDLKAAKRYIRFVKTFNSGGGSCTVGVVVLKGEYSGDVPGA